MMDINIIQLIFHDRRNTEEFFLKNTQFHYVVGLTIAKSPTPDLGTIDLTVVVQSFKNIISYV